MTQSGHTEGPYGPEASCDAHWFQPASAAQYEQQKEWEMRTVRRAVSRYRAMLRGERPNGTFGKAPTLADVQHGRSILVDVVPALIPRIADAQKEGRTRISSSTGGRPSPWWWLIGLLPPDVLAVLTCTTALGSYGATSASGGSGAAYAGIALEVASRVQFEAEFGAWRARGN